jgi:hypothetical protein
MKRVYYLQPPILVRKKYMLYHGTPPAQVDDLQIREEHWVVADLIGKGKHVRTVPMPNWVKCAVDSWTRAAGITTNFIFRAVSRTGAIWGSTSHLKPFGTL